MKRQIVFFSLIILILIGCGKLEEKAYKIQHDFEFNQDISSTNRIEIRAKKTDQTEGSRDQTSFQDSFLETKSLEQVKFLDSLLSKTPKTDYCCCPNSDYSVDFFDDKTLVDRYFADTLQLENKVIIYERSYQFSFEIEMETWEKFLEILKKN